MRGLYWSPGDQSEASICCMFVSVRVTLGCEMFHPWSDWPQCARPGPGPAVLALYYPGGEGRGHTTESDIHILQHTSYQAWPGPGPNEWCNYYFSLLGYVGILASSFINIIRCCTSTERTKDTKMMFIWDFAYWWLLYKCTIHVGIQSTSSTILELFNASSWYLGSYGSFLNWTEQSCNSNLSIDLRIEREISVNHWYQTISWSHETLPALRKDILALCSTHWAFSHLRWWHWWW